jgi:hypothetical protein
MSLALRSTILMGIVAVATALQAADDRCPPGLRQFLRNNCVDCHQGTDAEAGLDLAQIDSNLDDPGVAARWIQVFDRVADGEMPPEDYGELDREEKAGFLTHTSDWISERQRREFATLGRVRSRRLSKVQLERTLHDLLAIDLPLADLLPDEPRIDGFNNIADGQSMSHFLLESHLNVVDTALDAAMARATERDDFVREYDARGLARANPRSRCRDPEMLDGKAVVWSSGLAFYGRITSTTVRESGWYRITFTASSLKQPDNRGVWCSVRTGRCVSGAPLMSWVGSFEATPERIERTMVAWIPADHMIEIRPADATLDKAKFRGGQVGAGEGDPQDVPGVALHSMRIEEIHPGGDVQLVRDRLFGEMPVEVDPKTGSIRYIGEHAVEDAERQLRRFTQRAFRRPVTDDEMESYLGFMRESLQRGDDPVEVLRASYRAVLCSPRFVYLVEPVGPLDDHAIASRLSYMLWGTMPDDELFQQADQGRLRDDGILSDQVERMLRDEKGKRFVQDFASQWLDLTDIDFTEPDRKLYRDFDPIVQNAMLDETHAFLQSLLDADAEATRLIDADYTFLNSRLARYYDIDGVEGEELRYVELDHDSHRGGLLAQGAILKVTANGTNTSPVLRGIWVSERILGTPIPPPPENVPAVEPDIRGAKTIRDQLQLHLADTSCAGCHYKIDPPGYALENFDAAGQWRSHYTAVEKGRSKRGAEIDASFTLPDGREFGDFDEFRELVAARPEPIARNFAEKLIVYGTGAPIAFADRAVVADLVERTADRGYGLRSLLHQVVASPIFLSK